MKKVTYQMEKWMGEFGQEYTDRNSMTLDELDESYRKKFGFTRTQLNERFLGQLDKDIRILEVGCNIGNQLLLLEQMGFRNLYGVEVQPYAARIAKQRCENCDIVHGSGFDIPFKDGFFDLVFSSGVLIHISPDDIARILGEIYRCSREYIWGFEYFAKEYQQVRYRDNEELLWKTDFASLYLDTFDDLEEVKRETFSFIDNENENIGFLLRKRP